VRRSSSSLAGVLLLVGAAAGCSGSGAPCRPGAAGADDGTLASSVGAYCMVTVGHGAVTANPGVTPYDLNTPLFSDYAVKYRTVWLPPGTSATYVADGVVQFPVGTVITKSFGFPADFRVPDAPVKWIETRVLIHATTGWTGASYVWDDAQKDARISVGGEILQFTFIDSSGSTQAPNYLVPSQSQCPKCHQDSGRILPLGPWAGQLNRDFAYADGTENELSRWSRLGLLSGAPPAVQAPRLPVFDDPTTGSVEERARAYLQANCSYCHNGSGGEARTTGLVLLDTEADPYSLGECKAPIAAGKAAEGQQYDVVPGHPELSILVYRMVSTAPAVAMPELGRSLEHVEGVELVSNWISAMDGGTDGGCP